MHLFTTAGAGRRLRRALLAVTVTAGALATGAIAQLGAAPTASTASVATTWSASGRSRASRGTPASCRGVSWSNR